MYRILFPATLFLLAGFLPAAAKDLKILTGAGMAVPVRETADAFGARTGVAVRVTSDTAGGVQKRIEAGEAFDLVIGPAAMLDALARENLAPVHHHDLAQMMMGIAVKKGGDKPEIDDAPAVRTLLRTAGSIAYVDPASGGIAGAFFLALADRLGVGQEVRARAVLQASGADVAQAVADGAAQYGVTLVSEMLPNKDVMVWPLPDDVQMTTIYAAAVPTNAENALDAAALLEDLRGQEGHQASQRSGLKPVSQ